MARSAAPCVRRRRRPNHSRWRWRAILQAWRGGARHPPRSHPVSQSLASDPLRCRRACLQRKRGKWAYPGKSPGTPHPTGGHTPPNGRAHPAKQEGSPRQAGGLTPPSRRAHPTKREGSPHQAGGLTPPSRRAHPTKPEGPPHQAGGLTPPSRRAHPTKQEGSPHQAGGPTPESHRPTRRSPMTPGKHATSP